MNFNLPDSRKTNVFVFIFLALVCLIMLYISINKPIGDFGNYYYGSKILQNGKSMDSLYANTHWFNEQIKFYGEKDYFENYAPVPPLNLLLFSPFTFLSAGNAKLLFNVIGLIILSVSLARFLKTISITNQYAPVLLFILMFPLFRNIVEGQGYLLVTAAFLEIYLAYTKRRMGLVAFYISLLFHFKLFPVFIIGYFIFRKEYKVVAFTFVFTVFLSLLGICVTGKEIWLNYFTEIVPRLLKTEVVDPFYYGHQSFAILSNTLFSYDALSNPNPVFNSFILAGILNGLINAIVIYTAYLIVQREKTENVYGIFIFCGMLISAYITSYALLILLPFILLIFNFRKRLWLILVLIIIFNLPMTWVQNAPFIFKYFRLFGMLAIFIFIVFQLKLSYRPIYLLLVCSALILLNIMSGGRTENHYYVGIQKNGIDYEFNISEDKIILKTCFGYKDETDTLVFKNKITKYKALNLKQDLKNILGSVVSKGNIKNPVLINDSVIVYLSDINRGVGMYKLRMTSVLK